MSFVAESRNKITVAASRFRSAVSESLIQSIAGAVNYLLNSILPIGTIAHSMLTESQFQAETSVKWILADGRDVSGSDYSLETGYSNVPDLRGVFLRGKNNGRSDTTGNASGEQAIGTYQSDTNKSHTHFLSSDVIMNTGGPIEYDEGSELGIIPRNETSPDGGLEARPRSVTVNVFIRINR